MSDPNVMLKLKNGSEAPKSAVDVIMLSLRTMLTSDIPSMLAVVDLVEYCRHGTEITGKSLKILKAYGLVENDGRVHDVTRDVVLSSAMGESYQMAFGSPYA